MSTISFTTKRDRKSHHPNTSTVALPAAAPAAAAAAQGGRQACLEPNDIRMIKEAKNDHLAPQELPLVSVYFALIDDFNRELFLRFHMRSSVNDAELPFTNKNRQTETHRKSTAS